MKKVFKNAFPEGIFDGNWSVEQGFGVVNISEKKLSVPLGPDISDQHVRNHEYFHIRFSPTNIGKYRSDDDVSAIKAFEDCRVNILGVNSGVEVAKAITEEDMNKFHSSESSMSPFLKVCLIISTWSYDGYDELLTTLSPFEKKIAEDSISKIVKHVDSFDEVKKLAFELVDLFKIPEDKPEDIGESVRESAAKEKAEELDEASDDSEDEPDEDEVPDEPKLTEKFESDDEDERLADSTGLSGKMEIVHCALTIKNVWHKRKNTDTGYVFRHPDRVLTDGRCFSANRKAPFIGTILIDCSGSMRLSTEQIELIVREGCGCTVAGYSGHGSAGKLQILSENGHMVSELPNFQMGNVIDVPALNWLSEHRGNKIWISDGGVTGIGDHLKSAITADCANIVDKHEVMNVLDVDSAVEYIQKIKAKHM